MGMAHAWCINNPIIVLIFLLGWISVAYDYVRFVKVNNLIRKTITDRDGVFQTEKTFRWFSLVFYTCAATRIISIITLFFGIYWAEAIFIIVNAITIRKTLYIYKSQLSMFTAKSFSLEQVVEAQEETKVEVKNLMINRLEKSNIGKEAKAEILKIVQTQG